MRRSFAWWRRSALAKGATLAAVACAVVLAVLVVGGNGEDAGAPLVIPQTRPEAGNEADGGGLGRGPGSRDPSSKGGDRRANAGDGSKARGKNEAGRAPESGSPSDGESEGGRSSDRGDSLAIFGGKVERTPSGEGQCRLTLPSGETRIIDDCKLPGR